MHPNLHELLLPVVQQAHRKMINPDSPTYQSPVLNVVDSNYNSLQNDPLLLSPNYTMDAEEDISLRPNDVVCGRDIIAKNHPGNMMYRDLIRSHRSAYQIAHKREEKKWITELVIQGVHQNGGRFMVDRCGVWVEQLPEKVYDKVSHGLRSTALLENPVERQKATASSDAEEDLFQSVLEIQEEIYRSMVDQEDEKKNPPAKLGEKADESK